MLLSRLENNTFQLHELGFVKDKKQEVLWYIVYKYRMGGGWQPDSPDSGPQSPPPASTCCRSARLMDKPPTCWSNTETSRSPEDTRRWRRAAVWNENNFILTVRNSCRRYNHRDLGGLDAEKARKTPSTKLT